MRTHDESPADIIVRTPACRHCGAERVAVLVLFMKHERSDQVAASSSQARGMSSPIRTPIADTAQPVYSVVRTLALPPTATGVDAHFRLRGNKELSLSLQIPDRRTSSHQLQHSESSTANEQRVVPSNDHGQTTKTNDAIEDDETTSAYSCALDLHQKPKSTGHIECRHDANDGKGRVKHVSERRRPCRTWQEVQDCVTDNVL